MQPNELGPYSLPHAAVARRAHNTWSAQLAVETRHPFFFDHPLDHVPAMLMVFGLLDLLDAAYRVGADDGCRRLRMKLDFPRFCELSECVELEVCAKGDGSRPLSLAARTSTGVVCSGVAELALEPMVSTCRRLTPDQDRAASGDLVHKANAANVLLGPVWGDAQRLSAHHRDPGSTHYLAERSPAAASAGELIEATRQLANLTCHVALKSPPDSQHLVHTLEVDIPHAILRGADFRYECLPPPLRSRRAPVLTVGVLAGAEGDVRLGEVRWHARITSQAAYRALRDGRADLKEAKP